MLAIEHLSFSYGMVQALHDLTMEMPQGKVTCVMGRNGVGKTTLMKNIMGLLKQSSGTVTLGEKVVSGLAAHQRARARTDGLKTPPEELFELFPILKTMSKRMGGDLSGGQQQQLAIARALAGDPKVLLLDEPTEGIQPNIIQQIGHVLRKLVTEKNMTIVLVEQYLDFVREFGNRFYVMNRGRVVAKGNTEDLSAEIVHQHLSV
jgi:urea transport system ATP-binding protein